MVSTSSPRPAGTRLLASLALPLTYGIGLWLVVLHETAGGQEHGHPPLLVHWLRDATLALPAVLVAVCAAGALAERWSRRSGGVSRGLDRAVLAATAAAAASAAFGAGVPVHAWLFEAHEAQELPLQVHALRDALLALACALPLTAVLLALRDAPRPRLALAALGVLALAVVSGASVRAAALGPGQPCPVGAPLKQFSVQAIDVDIPLNRFGDHDPAGKMYVLGSRVSDVRAQEASRKVSTGLRDDPLQPLVIRANEGDCVEIAFTNNASGGDYGMHIDGLSFEVSSSGDAVGRNALSAVARGASATYRYFVPDSPTLEGAHYIRPGPGHRAAVSHGLFGVLAVEPPGSKYLHLKTGQPLESGWEATIVPGTGRPSFREFVQIYHEIGDENTQIIDATGSPLPRVDPLTGSYRPAARAMNYRSEPFSNRMKANPNEEAQGYGSYAFGDPATPSMRGYLRDPTKIRLVHGGSEMFHVFHLHGGGDRWRFNPLADKTYDYADTGLNKHPKTQLSPSTRIDSQSFGPGENYNLEIEGGAGAVQQAAGDFLYHCHIASHYVSGMWAFWRVFDTLQPDLAPLPDRPAPVAAVDSAGLIGRTMPDGTVLSASNLDDWIRPQLPAQGIRRGVEDATVWDWTVDRSNPAAPIYLGEPEDTRPWPNLPNLVPGHPGALPVDEFVGTRPKIRFNPSNGRPAWPLLRPHIGFRPPFSPNGHSGAPWLGENGNAAKVALVDAYAGRADGLCPTGSAVRRFNVVAITRPIRNTRNAVDEHGMIFVLAKNKDAVLAGTKPAEPLAIRTNIGECDAITLTSELKDEDAFTRFSKVNMHIHHVQFDPQASDGVITGFSYEQSVRPYRLEDPTLTAAVAAGSDTLPLSSVAKFRPGVWIGIGLGTEKIEVRQIKEVDAPNSRVKLTRTLASSHAAGEWAGVEFVQYRWYPDVQLDNVFWHDHVDGIHGWGHGLVGQLIVEPPGSTYHDPRTGAQVDSGTIVDIRTTSALAPGLVEGSFREFALWTIDENPNSDSTINLKAEPWADRLSGSGDPDLSLLFSSYRHGDPITPLPRAYPGDPFVIRTINVGPSVDGLHFDGHRFFLENRYVDANGKTEASPLETLPYGISERFTLALDGGAGGKLREPGDYLYMNSIGRRFRQGAWGILRVLPGRVDDLQPLPGTSPPAGGSLPTPTGGRPPTAGAGEPCPAGAAVRSFDVSAVDQPTPGNTAGKSAAFVLSAQAAAVAAGTAAAEPLVLHAAAGECVSVRFANRRTVRASFHLGELLRRAESSGVNVGFTPEQTVAPGQSRTYRFYADAANVESALIADFGGADYDTVTTSVELDAGRDGVYGALVVAPAGSTFTDPVTGAAKDVGSQVDVHPPGSGAYRDFTLLLSDRDPRIGQNVMPYPTRIEGPALLNYASAPREDISGAFNSAANGGDPSTPILRAYAGDPVRVHALLAPGSEQPHVFSLGGLSWPIDPGIHDAEEVESRLLVPWGSLDAHVIGGAGGRNGSLGDFFAGDLRRPFTVGGAWALQRVLSRDGCPLVALDGAGCSPAPAPPPPDTTPPTVAVTAPSGTVSGTVTVTADASDDVGVAGVRFRLDGADLGGEDTTAPFSVSWDTTTATEGEHTLTAIARDAADNTTTSAAVTVIVDNVVAPPPAPSPPPSGLVAAYSFDAGNGTTLSDVSGTGNHGTLSGATWAASGRFGGALFFDGLNDSVSVPDSPSLDLSRGMTLEAWVKPSTLTDWMTVLMKEAGTQLAYALYARTDATHLNQPSGFIHTDVDKIVRGGSPLPSGAWTHLAVTYDAAAFRLYVNGTEVASLPLADTIPASTGALRIGGNSIWGEWFTGLIDEVRIYNRALGAAEIGTDMNSAVGGGTTPPADTTAPAVTLTAPAAGGVSGLVTVSASASDDVGVAGVQFKLDGANLGAEDTDAPYAVAWDTTTATNASHTLTAVARDAAGNATTSAAVAVTVDNTVPPPTGLVAAYSFNAGSGTAVSDSSGSGNHGTLSGATWTIAGRFGGALSFDGVNDWVTVPDAGSLDLTTAMTLEAWVKPAALTDWMTVLMKERTGNLSYAIYARTNAVHLNQPAGFANTGVDRITRGGSPIATNTWTHLAVTYDGSTLSLYVNGNHLDSILLSDPMVTGTGALRIGGNSIWGEWFTGLIDEVRIYNRARSAAEVWSDMNTALG